MIETVIVMVLVAIVFVVSYVKLTDRDAMKLHAASRKLTSDLRYAQSLAIARRVKAGVTFDVAANSYSVFQGTRSNIVTDPMNRQKTFVVDFDIDSNLRGVQLASASFGSAPVLAYDPMGTPLDSGYVPLSAEGVVIVSFQGVTDTVKIGVNTGRVKLSH